MRSIEFLVRQYHGIQWAHWAPLSEMALWAFSENHANPVDIC